MQARLWTINALAVELGRDRRALSRALEDLEPDESEGTERVTRKYRLARVIEHLYSASPDGEALNGEFERARKDREAADKLALENAKTRGELAVVSDVVRFVGDHNAAVRAKLLALPAKLAPLLATINDTNVIAAAIRAEIYAVLAELAEWGPSEAVRGGDEAGDSGLEAAAGTDRQSVGRRRTQAQ